MFIPCTQFTTKQSVLLSPQLNTEQARNTDSESSSGLSIMQPQKGFVSDVSKIP